MTSFDDFAMVYRPYVFVHRKDNEWTVKFDWDDSYIGFEQGDDFTPDRLPDDDELYSMAESADSFLTEFLKKNGVWSVSPA
jgi:hypothetical protein